MKGDINRRKIDTKIFSSPSLDSNKIIVVKMIPKTLSIAKLILERMNNEKINKIENNKSVNINIQ